ncbi:uncharacterized protein NPIL_614761 [Nephila pilipes]|uniref:Uncharacterized protein n=1 Tax=Nephila pilipes TaxID=299642 RepID=A0A8X6PHK2_NEPPI|nr:uncharacterized protein NPIL_614761 [Nephila pilipes]
MYFGITIILRPEEYFSIPQISSVWILLASNYIAYLGQTLSGSFLYEASEDLWFKVQEALISENEFSNLQQKLLSVLEKGLYLTVWKIVPIKRNFILASLGTVLTYCLLIDNLRSS